MKKIIKEISKNEPKSSFLRSNNGNISFVILYNDATSKAMQ